MKFKLLLPILGAVLLVIGTVRPESAPAAAAPTASASPAVLVELFTSEGCSTCPPADKLLAVLDANQPFKGVLIVALGEHVDYWNKYGWKDLFSSAQFTERQLAYAKALHIDDIYTPQMVVDGETQFVGSNIDKATEAIARAAQAPKADVALEVKGSSGNSVTLAIRAGSLPEVSKGDTTDVMLAITESALSSKVLKGENSGKELAHSVVTRKLVKIGSISGTAFEAERPIELNQAWKRPNLKAVVFLQERNSRRVLGVAQTKVS